MSVKYTVVCGETQWNITAPTNIMKHVLRLILVKGLENIDSINTFFDKKTLMELIWFFHSAYRPRGPHSAEEHHAASATKEKEVHVREKYYTEIEREERETENLADLC